MPNNNIQYLQRAAINTMKWDQCIDAAPNGLIYGYSFCLDQAAPGWEALVLGDYEAVMPLTAGKKYGIRYLFQPYFMPQLGVIGTSVDANLVDTFITALPGHFKLIDIDVHENNDTNRFAGFCTKRVNMLLSLQSDYAVISKRYHRLANRMIRRAKEEGVTIETGADVNDCMAFYKEQYGTALNMPDIVYERTASLFRDACLKGRALALAARKDGQLVGVYLLLYDQKAVYSVLGGSSPAGKKAGAFYLLTDYAIRHFAGTDRVFRFEGSDLRGIADFNSQFAPSVVYYNHLKINRLPALIKWLK